MQRGAAPETVFVCPNGIDTRLFRPDVERRQRVPPSVPKDAFVLGFHGRERPWHGFRLLAEAAEILLGKGFPVHLLVIGKGEFSALSGLPAATYTRLPWVEHAQIPSLIGRFDALAELLDHGPRGEVLPIHLGRFGSVVQRSSPYRRVAKSLPGVTWEA